MTEKSVSVTPGNGSSAVRVVHRPMGLISCIGIVVSSMVGAGIYTTSGFALADLGHPFLVLLAWLIAGLIAVCGAVSYGALAREFQESGGEYLFLTQALHPAAGFVAGWVSLVAGFTGAIAFAAGTMEAYLTSGLLGGVSHSLVLGGKQHVAECLIITASLLHLFSVKPGLQIQNLVVLTKFFGLILFLISAFAVFPVHWAGWQNITPLEWTSQTFPTMTLSLVWVSLSYCGFNAAIYAAEEVHDPGKTIPLAMVIGTVLVTLFYLLLNFVFLFLPLSAQISGQEQVALIAARQLSGPNLEWLLLGMIQISLFTSLSVMLLTGPRVYAKMASAGLMPRCFRHQGAVPRMGIMIQAALAILVLQFSTLKQLLSYLGFTLSLSAALTVSCLWLVTRLRIRQRWWTLVAAAVFVLATLLTALLAASRSPRESLLAIVTLIIGAALYPLLQQYGNHSQKSASGI